MGTIVKYKIENGIGSFFMTNLYYFVILCDLTSLLKIYEFIWSELIWLCLNHEKYTVFNKRFTFSGDTREHLYKMS